MTALALLTLAAVVLAGIAMLRAARRPSRPDPVEHADAAPRRMLPPDVEILAVLALFASVLAGSVWLNTPAAPAQTTEVAHVR